MSFEFFLARRYLTATRDVFGATITSAIAVGGVAVGVAALVVTLAVMTGFRDDIRNKILGAQPHIVVMGGQGTLPEGDWEPIFRDEKEVEAWAPYVMGQALIRKGSVTQGIVVKGVDPDREPSVTGLNKRMSEGSWANIQKTAEGRQPIFLGQELAKALHVGLGDRVLLAVPTASLGLSTDFPPIVTVEVSGILQTGLYDYDSSLAVIPIKTAQALFQMPGTYSGLGVRVKNPDRSVGTAMRLQKNVGSSASVRSWLALNRNLFAALKLEKTVMFIVLTLITLVAAFTIVSNLLLVTAQKVREIGILQAMGATKRSILTIFLMKGSLMGATGVGTGLALGVGIASILKTYPFIHLPADVYYVETLPVKILPQDLALVTGAALLIVLLATIYPARTAAKLDALTAIRQL